MATRKLLFNAGYTETNELYSLCLVPATNDLSIKICKMVLDGESGHGDHKLQNPKSIEFFDYTDDLFTKAFQQSYDRTINETIDQFVRWKYRNTKIYEILYYQKSGDSIKSLSSDTFLKVAINLINCDVKTLMYLYHLSECEDADITKQRFFKFLETPLAYKSNGRNSRYKLGISKNKEKVLKDFPTPLVLRYGNEVFDDDIDFLLDILRAKNNDINMLRYFLSAKQANPKIKYLDIARKAIVTNLENKDALTFARCMENIYRLSEGYKIFKEHGFSKDFRIVPTIAMLGIHTPNKAEEPNFAITDGEVFPIVSADELRYANAISNAMHREYIDQAEDKGCCFYLICRHKKYYIAEVLNGEVLNIFRNGKYVVLDIKGKENG